MKNKLKKSTILIAVLTVVFIVTALSGCTNYKKLRETGGTVDGKPITADTDVKTIVSQEVDETTWKEGMLNMDITQIFATATDGDKMPERDCTGASAKITQTIVLTDSVDTITFKASSICMATENAAYLLQTGETEYRVGGGEPTYQNIYQEAYIEITDNQVIGYARTDKTANWQKVTLGKDYLKEAEVVIASLEEEYAKFEYDTKVNAYVGTVASSVIKKINDFMNFNDEPYDAKMEVKFVDNKVSSAVLYADSVYKTGGNEISMHIDAQAIYYDYNNSVVEIPESIKSSFGN